MTLAMFSHVAGDTEWQEKPLDEMLAAVAAGRARECFDCEYDDGRRNFHCVAPCRQCDGLEAL